MKRKLAVTGLLIGVAITVLTTGAPTAQATVEANWPVGQPNTPRNPDDIFIDFEAGIDGIQIQSTLPSLKFTTTSGLNWQYGDIRTGAYNVYPYGGQSYETRGNFFAWLGATGDAGRIDFIGGGATYCSVLVSTASGVVLDAYNSDNTLIATSGSAGNNINTRTLTRLTVDAPTGQIIAYVTIHDTGNYWLMDELCTDANKAVIPVPGRAIGSHGDKFDVVFIPDNDYGSAADIDTWLPTFLDHINHQIDERFGGAAPVTDNLCKFNFYYTRMQGDARDDGTRTLPTDLSLLAPFADAFVIFHTDEFGDSTIIGTPSIYGAEGPVGRSFIHESGHGIFGLADEYDDNDNHCRTGYFQPDPNPNIWETEAAGRADATSAGWNPDDIQKFTDCSGDWWKLGTTDYIMSDGTFFANGWGTAGQRRIQWFLDQFPACAASEPSFAQAPAAVAEKAIWLKVQISTSVFSLVDQSFVADSPPNYLPGKHDFIAKVFSNGGALLGEFGINDPRIIIAESGYQGPTFLDSVIFSLVVPYFNSISRLDLVESATGNVKLSVDLSQYATATDQNHCPTNQFQDLPPSFECNNPVTVTLLVSDQDNDPLTVVWTVDGAPYATNLLAPGATNNSITGTFGYGTHLVQVTVTDGRCTTPTNAVQFVVADTHPPDIVCPTNITVEAQELTGAPVSFVVTASDLCNSVILDVTPTSGSIFPIGSSIVACIATDAAGNTNTCNFWVTVLGPLRIKQAVLSELRSLLATLPCDRPHGDDDDGESQDDDEVTQNADCKHVADAIKHLTKSLDPELWIDETHLQRKHGEKVFHEEKESVHKLRELFKDKKSSIPDTVLQGFIDRIVKVDRLLAEIAIQDSRTLGQNPKATEKAEKELTKGNEELADGKPENAIEHYLHAWQHATHSHFKNVRKLTNGAVELTISGISGDSYTVETSTNLVDWVPLRTGVNTDGEFQLIDAAAGKFQHRFYRVVPTDQKAP